MVTPGNIALPPPCGMPVYLSKVVSLETVIDATVKTYTSNLVFTPASLSTCSYTNPSSLSGSIPPTWRNSGGRPACVVASNGQRFASFGDAPTIPAE